MSNLEIHHGGGQVQIDHGAVLKTLNLNPNDPNTQALLLVCDRYGLDPVLKHMVLISGRPYVTRDGLLHIAHQSGQFDGEEVVEEGENADEWWAKVSIYRKDMGRPFTFRGRYPKKDAKHMAKYGPEMAVKVAEVMGLRRAFDVALGTAEEQWYDRAEQDHQEEARRLLRARWDDLKARTAELDDDTAARVKAWAGEVGLTWGAFTDTLADEWAALLETDTETIDAEVVEPGAATVLREAAEEIADAAPAIDPETGELFSEEPF